MTIGMLKITDFRNLKEVELSPVQCGLNLITGENGSGKTSLLESIHFLSTGRSFRTSLISPLINEQQNNFFLFSQIIGDNERIISAGVKRGLRESRMRIDDQEIHSHAGLASLLPVRVLNSQSHHFLDAGPTYRRKLLDWGLFYHNEEFITLWRSYERALKQRNAVLREGKPRRELEVWTEEVSKYGMALDQQRRDYLFVLMPYFQEMLSYLLVGLTFEIHYHPGWDEKAELINCLRQLYSSEMHQGFTLAGPHRADLEIVLNGIEVKHILSRGQQKLLICAMILAQGMLLNKAKNKRLVYLIDDLPAELDRLSRRGLIQLLRQQNSQVFITAIENQAVCDELNDGLSGSMGMFHVEHGRVRPL